jgi:serine/threonine protein kinase
VQPEVDSIWVHAGPEVARIGGWKLHVASVPCEALELLAAVVPILERHDASFKVLRDQDLLASANSAELGETQVGKFVTVYPRDDREAVALAHELADATAGFAGPPVPTDVHLGGTVWARYGSFVPIVRADRLGTRRSYVEDASGALREDVRAVPYDDDRPSPFGALAQPSEDDREGRGTLLGSGYRIVDVIKPRVTGSVFLALDLRTRELVEQVVVKQARAHCFSDEWGRDGRDRLRRARDAMAALHDVRPVPDVLDHFGEGRSDYLVMTRRRGVPTIDIATRLLGGRPWSELADGPRRVLLAAARALVETVEAVHAAGIVHRDISARNVLVEERGDVALIDFELAHLVNRPDPPFGLGTEGFMSPQQASRQAPTFADDVHSTAACIVVLLTGADPRRVVADGPDETTRRLAVWTGATDQLVEVAGAALDPDPAARATLADLHAALVHPSAVRRRRAPESGHRWLDVARRSALGLTTLARRDEQSGLPLSTSAQREGVVTIEPHGYRGGAGLLYSLARADRLGALPSPARRYALQVAHWLADLPDDTFDGLPGLYFGRAGVAVALAEAASSGLLPASDELRSVCAFNLRGSFDWHDLTHGAAGQGLAALEVGRTLPELAGFSMTIAREAAAFLGDAQDDDGGWTVPPGVDGISGERLPGFAHGVAGIAYFLTTFSALRHASVDPAALRAAGWLERAAVGAGGALHWAYSDRHREHWHWWCHGAPGIALAFLRLFEVSGEPRYASIATRALDSIASPARSSNLTQCHGLAGLAEVLLEGHRTLHVERWRDAAWDIGDLLCSVATTDGDGLVWFAEDLRTPTADLMTGSGGVLHLFLRLADEDRLLGPPLLTSGVTAPP